MPKVGESATWVIFTLVVLAAASTLLPLQDPEIPGALQLVVLDGPGSTRTEQAMRPFCSYLSRVLDLNTQPRVVSADELRRGAGMAHILLGPVELLPQEDGYEVLAWVKGPGLRAEHDRPCAIYPADSLWLKQEAPRIIMGDPWTWAGGAGAAEFLERNGCPLSSPTANWAWGRNAYDHLDAISAMVYGAFDLALVRESDLKRALEMGLVDDEGFRFEAVASPGGGMALMAAPTLSSAARRQVRSAALNLDAYRFDPQHLMAASALTGLRTLGIEGFVPDRAFPNLRP